MAPCWRLGAWHPDLLSLLVNKLRQLPGWWNVLAEPHIWQFHQNLDALNFPSLRISNKSSGREAFLAKLLRIYQPVIKNDFPSSAKKEGQFSVLGVIKGGSLMSATVQQIAVFFVEESSFLC